MDLEGDAGAGAGMLGGGPGPDALDPSGFEDLRRRVAAAVRRNCPSWLREQAEDIVQNVLFKLLRSLRKSAGKRTFAAVYLEKMVYGAVVDEIRRVSRRRENPLEVEVLEAIPTARADPERRSSAGEIVRGILDCLSRLSRPRRLAVTLYLHGWTVPEAAGQLRWNLKRTESLVYRGLGELRGCLGRKGLAP